MGYSIAIVLLGLLPTAMFFLAGLRNRVPGDLPPARVLGWTFLIGYTLKSLYLAYAVQSGSPFKTEELSRDIILEGQLAISLAAVGMLAGLAFMATRPVAAPAPQRAPSPVAVPLYWLTFAFCLGLMLVYFQLMGFTQQLLTLQFTASKFFVDAEGVESSLGFLTIGADVLIVFFGLYLAHGRRPKLLSVHGLATLFIAVAFLLASRRNGVLIIGALGLMVLGARPDLTGAGRKLGRLVVIGAAILALAFASSVRQQRTTTGIEQLSVSQSIGTILEHGFEGAYAIDPAKTAAIIDQTRARDLYLDGASFLNFFLAPIPRVLWPDKPVIRIGPFVAQDILFYRNDSGAPPGAIGEFYINFGWAGVVLGAVLIGMACGLAHGQYLRDPHAVGARVRYALIMLVIALFMITDSTFAVLALIKYSVAFLIGRAFWRSRVSASAAFHLDGWRDKLIRADRLKLARSI